LPSDGNIMNGNSSHTFSTAIEKPQSLVTRSLEFFPSLFLQFQVHRLQHGELCRWHYWLGWYGKDVCEEAQRCRMEVKQIHSISICWANSASSKLTFFPDFKCLVCVLSAMMTWVHLARVLSSVNLNVILAPDLAPDSHWWKISATLLYFVWTHNHIYILLLSSAH